jgi:hypothetical protein
MKVYIVIINQNYEGGCDDTYGIFASLNEAIEFITKERITDDETVIYEYELGSDYDFKKRVWQTDIANQKEERRNEFLKNNKFLENSFGENLNALKTD